MRTKREGRPMASKKQEADPTELPAVQTKGVEPYVVVDEVLSILHCRKKEGREPDPLYRWSSILVRIDREARPVPKFAEVTPASFGNWLIHRVSFLVGDRPGLPDRQYLAFAKEGAARFADPVRGITQIPVFREDGTLLTMPGHDAKTQLVYIPPGKLVGGLSPTPGSMAAIDAADLMRPAANLTREDAHRAAMAILGDRARGIMGPLVDFPMDGPSRANALALFLTPFVRPLLGSTAVVPLALLDAPGPGAGKTLLAKVFSLIATGQDASTVSLLQSDVEMRKALVAFLLGGTTVIVIDNAKGTISSSALEEFLTARWKKDRLLGHSELVDVENNATWMLAGNNIDPGDDMVRRSYLIRISPEEERP